MLDDLGLRITDLLDDEVTVVTLDDGFHFQQLVAVDGSQTGVSSGGRSRTRGG